MPARSPSAGEGGLPGRCALVTGGSSGIGRAVALALALEGVGVHLIGRSERTRAVAGEIAAAGGRAWPHCGSVADESFCRSVLDAIEQESGRLDILVNAAAVLGQARPFAETALEEWSEVVRTNLLGTAHCMRHALPGMLSRGFGRIINFAGGGAAYAYPRFTAYGTSKCALVRLTDTVAAEVAGSGVTVNILAPGAVETPMLDQVRRQGGEVRTTTDIKEPVQLVLFLSGSAAAHITGRFIHVRDNYQDPELYSDPEMLMLRRRERR